MVVPYIFNIHGYKYTYVIICFNTKVRSISHLHTYASDQQCPTILVLSLNNKRNGEQRMLIVDP